jgi:hypothetical protein
MNYNVIADSLKKSFFIRKKKNLLLTAVAILGLAAATMAQSVPSYVPTNGLVGWWPFNGNANDESGNGNNGTVNGATLTTDRFGNANQAYDFDGVDDFIQTPNNSLAGSFTISGWYKMPTYNINSLGANDFIFFCNHSGINDNNRNVLVGYRNFGLEYGHSTYIQNNSSNMTGYYGLNDIPIANVWHHIVFVFDNGVSVKMYLDNNLVYSNISVISNSSLPSLPFFFGVGIATQFNFFQGQLDDFAVWNRVLSQSEILNLYIGCQQTVNSQPASQTIPVSSNAQFTVGSSDPSATFQWQTDLGVGFQNLNSVGQYSGTTNDTLTVSNVTMSNNNQPFRCIITSGSCTDTSAVAVLTVNNTVGSNEISPGSLFSVFPNPAQNVINLKADATLLGESYAIMDNAGRTVLSGTIASETTMIELGNLSGGIYIFNIGKNMKQQFKIVKQ